MASATPLSLQVNGHIFQLSREKYSDAFVTTATYLDSEISADRLLLPSGQSVAEFKKTAQTAYRAQTGPARVTLVEVQNRASQLQFGKPLAEVLHGLKQGLRQRYANAVASEDSETRITELSECARQGHVQASLDLGLQLDAARNAACIDALVDAHNMRHPESLLCLAKVLFKRGDPGGAMRVLLLGAWCGSVRCSEFLLLILAYRPQVYEMPACLKALEDACHYRSIHAAYLLGVVLTHGASCRDEERGRATMEMAGRIRHPLPSKGQGKPVTKDGKQYYPAGTLAHIELLIDQELHAMHQSELEPKFMQEVSKLPADASDETRAAFVDLLAECNPISDRMFRRIADWLESGHDEPPDDAKLARMKELFSVREYDASTTGCEHD